MTTDKKRITVWMNSTAELDALFDELRRLAPIEKRGGISRSTAVEAAVKLALADVQANGRDADVFKAMVTSL